MVPGGCFVHAVHDAAGREAEGGLEKRRIGAFTAGAERRVGDNGVREARGPWKAGQLGYVGFDELHPAQDAFEGIGVIIPIQDITADKDQYYTVVVLTCMSTSTNVCYSTADGEDMEEHGVTDQIESVFSMGKPAAHAVVIPDAE